MAFFISILGVTTLKKLRNDEFIRIVTNSLLDIVDNDYLYLEISKQDFMFLEF